MKKILISLVIFCLIATTLYAVQPVMYTCRTTPKDVLLILGRQGGFYFSNNWIIIYRNKVYEINELGHNGDIMSSCKGILSNDDFTEARRIATDLTYWTTSCKVFDYPSGCADICYYTATTKHGTVTGWVPPCENYPQQLINASDFFDYLFTKGCVNCVTTPNRVLIELGRQGGIAFTDYLISVYRNGRYEIQEFGIKKCVGILSYREYSELMVLAEDLKSWTSNCTYYEYPPNCADAWAYSAITKDGIVAGWVPDCEDYPKPLIRASNVFSYLFKKCFQ